MSAMSAAFGTAWSASLARAPEPVLREWLAFALEMCDAADALALASFRRDVATTRKPDRTFVTAADQAIEREIRERIRARYPDHGLVGEEYGEAAGDAATRWFIDPIDATHNYIRGIPVFATLLAVEHDSELQLGVISAPAMRERWYAWRGGGAWSTTTDGERRIVVSGIDTLGDSQLVYGSGPDARASGQLPGFDALLDSVWRTRGFGDFWCYALVAEGAAELTLEVDAHPWDLAAPLVLVEEAGGRVSDVDGARRIDARSFVASNGLVHDEALRRVRQAPSG
jgi:histidinol-phosphatase